MQALHAIIFDMDGTLADTEEIHRQAFNLAFEEFGFEWQWSPAEYHDLLAISGGKERIRRYLELQGVLRGRKKARWKLGESVHKRKSEIYRDLLGSGHIVLRPGVQRLIGEARDAGVDLGIATSSSQRNLETLLHQTLGDDAMSMFAAVVTCDIVEDKKPSPAAYQFALAEMGRNAENCAAIEDTRNGHLAALAAGLTTIITTHAYTMDNDFSGAALVIDGLAEPGRPFRIAGGDAHGAEYVDLALIRRLLPDAGALPLDNEWPAHAAAGVK